MTTPYNSRQLQVIDERILRAAVKRDAVGRVVSVEAARMRARVIFDGATVDTPVKVEGRTWCQAGDRVLLHYYGPAGNGAWYVTGVTNRILGPNVTGTNLSVATGSTTSATPANLPGGPSFSWTKRWDSTPAMLYGSCTAFTATATASMGFYLGLTLAGVQTVYLMWDLESPINIRFGTGTVRVLPDAGAPTALAAGTYTVNLMWARTVGAGSVNTNSPDDHASAHLIELGV